MKVIKLQTDDLDTVANAITDMKGRTMVLVRGLPGHNRNTFARELADEFPDDAQCFGFDDLFTVDPAAIERLCVFQPARVEESHIIVRRKTEAAMHRGAPVVIVANPFLSRDNIVKFFLPTAEERGYNVIVVTLSDETNPDVLFREDEHGNHAAPPEAIIRMLEQWEQDPDLSRTPPVA